MPLLEVEVGCGRRMSRDIFALVFDVNLRLRLFRWSSYSIHCRYCPTRFDCLGKQRESSAKEAILSVGKSARFCTADRSENMFLIVVVTGDG
jgi:hypothetical protein